MSISSTPQTAPHPKQLTGKKWALRPAEPIAAQALIHELGLAPLAARVLAARGLTDPELARPFLKPSLAQIHDPFALLGMEAAVVRIGRAIAGGEKVWIWGDYDVDGITATAILVLTLTELGCPVDYYIPHRISEGYGLNGQAIEQLAAEGATLLVTVDCGVSAVAEADLARRLGVDLIITDHHEPGPALPEAFSVINPKQPGCTYPCKALSGSGIAFKLAHALLKRFHKDEARAREFLRSLLDLAALGTVADIVPLVGENRCLVHAGLERLRKQPRPGIVQLLEVAHHPREKIDTGTIGFVLGPRLNAAGRTEHAMFAVELLLSGDRRRLRDLAGKLDQFNENRRAIEARTVAEALELIGEYTDDQVLVVAQDGWHHGVLGIVASRIQAIRHRPVLVISIDGVTAKGSGRSIAGFDLHEALTACADCLEQFGGHPMAAGLSLEPAKIDQFRTAINQHARTIFGDQMPQPTIRVDTIAQADELTQAAVEALEALAPFGIDNPKPVIGLEGWQLTDVPRILKERHLKLTVAAPDGRQLVCLGWNMSQLAASLTPGQRLDLAGVPIINTWNGRTSVELELRDLRSAIDDTIPAAADMI